MRWAPTHQITTWIAPSTPALCRALGVAWPGWWRWLWPGAWHLASPTHIPQPLALARPQVPRLLPDLCLLRLRNPTGTDPGLPTVCGMTCFLGKSGHGHTAWHTQEQAHWYTAHIHARTQGAPLTGPSLPRLLSPTLALPPPCSPALPGTLVSCPPGPKRSFVYTNTSEGKGSSVDNFYFSHKCPQRSRGREAQPLSFGSGGMGNTGREKKKKISINQPVS